MSPPAIAFSTPAQRELLRILSLAYGGERLAVDAVDLARVASAAAVLPETGHALFELVAHGLGPILTADLGPRLTIAVLAELERLRDFGRDPASSRLVERVAPTRPSAPPATGPRERRKGEAGAVRPRRVHRAHSGVLLVDADRLGRMGLARALIRRQSDVTVVESIREVKAALVGSDDFGVAIVDLGHGAPHDVLGLIVILRRGLPVLARASDQEAARAMLRSHRVATFATCDRDAPVEDVAAVAAGYVSVVRRGE